MNRRIWILGAADPEMVAIEILLRKAGEQVAYAQVGGRRVSPGNAYQAEGTSASVARPVVLVECGGPALDGLEVVARCDHHRPGDPGYGLRPAKFWGASSLGQVCGLLLRETYTEWRQGPHEYDEYSRVIRRDLLLVAAADHCLGAAYRGECPGVEPDALMRWRVASRATFQGRPEAEVLADVERARLMLRIAPALLLNPVSERPHTHDHDWSSSVCDGCDGCAVDDIFVRDLRRETPIPELPEAAARDDVAYISGPLVGPDGKRKYTCSGRPEHVKAFLETWAEAQGLIDLYGDPARGFAGGYAS